MEVFNSDLLDKIKDHVVSVAKKATCKRSKCGSVIVWKGVAIGEGFNSMPCNETGECFKENLAPSFKSDRTCCVHAEQRAIINAFENGYGCRNMEGSTLYFIRLDENDNPKYSGEPYCSICSKMALDVGIEKFALWRKEGWCFYDTKEYNELTFKFQENNG